jgi:hypothetical protein
MLSSKKTKRPFIIDPVSISKKEILKSMKEILKSIREADAKIEKWQRALRKLNKLLVEAPLDRSEVVISKKRLEFLEKLLGKNLDYIPHSQEPKKSQQQ